MRARVAAMCVAVGAAACAPSDDESVGAERTALGEVRDGFPSWAERLVWVYTNRLRADPAAVLADCEACADRACYAPSPPLNYSHELGRAARFHSQQLEHVPGVLMHSSPCRLAADISDRYAPGPCADADPACACASGAFECVYPSCSCSTSPASCTSFDARVSMFGGFALAENIAGFASPLGAVDAWVTEPYDVADCAHRGGDSHGRTKGHRVNLLTMGPAVGIGVSSAYVTADFGFGEPAAKLVAGVHYPEDGTSFELRANWYDDFGPSSAIVNVEGSCATMSLERGSPANGTYFAAVTTGHGCRRYRFVLEDRDGRAHAFPTTGAFGIGCTDEWLDAPPPPCGCAGGACADASAPIPRDGGSPPPRDAAIEDAASEDGSADGLPMIGERVPPSTLRGSCSVGRAETVPPVTMAFALLLVVLARLRRRRTPSMERSTSRSWSAPRSVLHCRGKT